MEKQKIKVTKLLVFMALCCALLVGNLLIPSQAAEAATKKAAISATKLTIPVGKIESKVNWNINIYEISTAQKLTVKNAVKGATYQFTSSNSKVVKISKDGGYLTGLKAGSATITCTQTLKGKKTTVGKCAVTVKGAKLAINDYDNVFPVGSGQYDLTHYFSAMEPLFAITYRNPNATYTLSSSNKNFSIKLVKNDASKAKSLSDDKYYQTELKNYIGSRYFYGYQFTAKKAGTYTITVKETYNKKTKNVGTFKVVIKDTSISEPEVNMLLGNEMNVFSLVNYTKANTMYYFVIKDYDEANEANNILTFKQYGSELYLYANKTGTAEVTVREGSEKGKEIGTAKIVVAEAPCTGITVDEEYSTYVDDSYFYIPFDLEPWDTTDKVTIESDNTKVLKVEYDQEYGEWKYTPLKVGEANVTIKCGDQSVVTKVVVEEW
jgi:hypothetical protein